MLRLVSLLASLATASSGGFAANLPFAFIQSESMIIPSSGTNAYFSSTECCQTNEVMAVCCSLNSGFDLTARSRVTPFASTAEGKSSKAGYQIYFETPTSVLGLPSATSFILNPVSKDKSLLRDALAYNISNALGMQASKTVVLELFAGKKNAPRYPHDYRGIYILEQVAAAHETLPIGLQRNLSQQANGFLLQVDRRANLKGDEIRLSDSGLVLQSVYPAKVHGGSKLWLTLLLDKLEGAIFKLQQNPWGGPVGAGSKPEDEWWMNQLHLQSCIDYFLLSELSNGIHSYGIDALVWFANGQLHFGELGM
jgi:hypothetical protein